MNKHISIKEASIEEAVKVNASIVEFGAEYPKEHFEERYKDKKHLIIVGYVDDQPAGYIVGYDKFNDGSFYCWMAGVNPNFRKMGLLKALMQYEDIWAKEHGYHTIRIKTRNNRREMLSYLIKYGFYLTEVEQRENIEENRIMLEKKL